VADLHAAGQELPWPCTADSDPDLFLLEGEVALIAEVLGEGGEILSRRTLATWVAPARLPAPDGSQVRLRFRLKVVRAAELWAPPAGGEPPAALVALPLAAPFPPAAAPLPHPAAALTIGAADADPVPVMVNWLAARCGTTARTLREPPADPHARLRALLEAADLIVRPVRLEADDLLRDCGDLVLLGADGPLLLLSQPGGYALRDPRQPRRAPRPLRSVEIARWTFPLPALSVQSALSRQARSARDLVRFSYGPASHPAAVLIAATALGLGIGFLLAVGREVGAARWIAGLGGVGALFGLGLALVSDRLRPALITALLSTLLGLLLPTVNTLLTNVALPEKDTALMVQMGALLLVAALADVALRWTESRTLVTVQQQGGQRLQLAALQRLLSLPTGFFRRYRVGDLSLRFGALSELQEQLQSLLSGGALQALLSGVFLLFMLRISVPLTALALLLAAVLVGSTVWIGRGAMRLERRREEQEGEANSRNLELIGNVAKLRLAGVEEAAARHWWAPYRAGIDTGYAVEERTALAGLFTTLLPSVGTLLLFLVITRLVADAGRNPTLAVPNVGELLGFFSAFATFLGAVASSAGLLIQAFELPVLLERARPLLEAQPESAEAGLDPGPLRGALALDGVSFRYGESGPWLLDDLTLAIRPGEFVAVVGPTGSGKSTLVRLLLGLERPVAGRVLVDGRPLERLRIDLVRRQIGVVPQNIVLLAGSLQEVIAGGSDLSLEEAWSAAEQAAVAEDIRALPMGMHTLLPEGGGSLSGGQRQRLAIARALARRPRALIFDEATSALDNRSQARVSRSLHALGLTRLVIAHRLSTVRHADRIVVLEAGRIVQEGRFAELIAQSGPFAALMRRQLAADPSPLP
jgi:ATP-binding cassette subfamily B protein